MQNNMQKPPKLIQYIDLLGVTYVTMGGMMGRMIWQRQVIKVSHITQI